MGNRSESGATANAKKTQALYAAICIQPQAFLLPRNNNKACWEE